MTQGHWFSVAWSELPDHNSLINYLRLRAKMIHYSHSQRGAEIHTDWRNLPPPLSRVPPGARGTQIQARPRPGRGVPSQGSAGTAPLLLNKRWSASTTWEDRLPKAPVPKPQRNGEPRLAVGGGEGREEEEEGT